MIDQRSADAYRLLGNSTHDVLAVRRHHVTGDGTKGTQTALFGREEAGGDPVGYRGPTACSAAGITYRQLDYWARTDLLRPSISEARGSGTQRRYSYRDLLELKVIKQLLDAGVSLQSTRRAIQCLRENLGADVASANLVLGGSDSLLAHSGEEVVDLLKGGQGVLNIVPLAGVKEAIDAAIHEMAPEGDSSTAQLDSAATEQSQPVAKSAVGQGG